jgi:DNA (cytosine-5)-methyltransferase 1
MRYLSLFSGCLGGDLGMQHLLGMECVGYVEIDEYCQRVIRQRQEDGLIDRAPIFTDIRAFISEGYAREYQGMVELITGGFPCQDISSAGSKCGIDGERSGLWKSMLETIRIIKPRYVFVENSPMLTVRGLGTVLRDLAQERFDARWDIISCADMGGVHLRERLWLVANHNSERRMVHAEWKYKNRRNLGNNIQTRTSTTWNGIEFKGPREIFRSKDSYPPILCRVDDGIPFRVERLKACGNAQVPIVAATAWRILAGHSRDRVTNDRTE